MPKSEVCEIPKGFGKWQQISVDDALPLKGGVKVMRCPECHGEVRPHAASEDGMAAHFEHLQAHEGCSLGVIFCGQKSPHPHAVESY